MSITILIHKKKDGTYVTQFAGMGIKGTFPTLRKAINSETENLLEHYKKYAEPVRIKTSPDGKVVWSRGKW